MNDSSSDNGDREMVNELDDMGDETVTSASGPQHIYIKDYQLNTSGNNVNIVAEDSDGSALINACDRKDMMRLIRTDTKVKMSKWQDLNDELFLKKFQTMESIKKSFTRHELQICVKAVAEKLKSAGVHFTISSNKDALVTLLFNLINNDLQIQQSKQRSKRKVTSLRAMCTKTIAKFPKHVLSCIYAEFLYPTRLDEWNKKSPFTLRTCITGIDEPIAWYSMPEFVENTYTYLFDFLDCHHLFVNARVKCCSTGMVECGIHKDAWMKIAQNSSENKSGLSLALVRDLVDKQSNAFARKTFSIEVETLMRTNGDIAEANFTKLLREWYEAEDDPGIDVMERIKRRLRLREWLLSGVHFAQFPPPGSHIKGIPHVMFEGLLTNIERRIQIIPFIKTGIYNPRSLGSLEAENFFGEFQELDPKGSGLIRPDDIPKAISTACELIGARLDPNRKFFMHTSQAKVYPTHQLSHCTNMEVDGTYFMTPTTVSCINPRNHFFDEPLRANRKSGKRKAGEISGPSMPRRGARSVREHHRCDETKILPHVRLGISFPE